MEQATRMIELMDAMDDKRLRQFYDHLEHDCNPYVEEFDDNEDHRTPDQEIIKETVLEILNLLSEEKPTSRLVIEEYRTRDLTLNNDSNRGGRGGGGGGRGRGRGRGVDSGSGGRGGGRGRGGNGGDVGVRGGGGGGASGNNVDGDGGGGGGSLGGDAGGGGLEDDAGSSHRDLGCHFHGCKCGAGFAPGDSQLISNTKSKGVLQRLLQRNTRDIASQAAVLKSIQTTLHKLWIFHERTEATHQRMKDEFLKKDSTSRSPDNSDEPGAQGPATSRKSRNPFRPNTRIEPQRLPAVGVISPQGAAGASMSARVSAPKRKASN